MMRYIHRINGEAKLLEALIEERIKPNIHAAIPELQICGKSVHASVEQ